MTDIVENDAEKYNAILAVHQALHSHPTDFRDTINAMLADRIQAEVEKKREEVARNVFNGEEPEAQADDQAPEEDETTDTNEPELEDEETPTEE